MSNVVPINKPTDETVESKQPAPQIYAAILAINAELPAIPKKKKGDGLKYDAYVTEEIVKTVKPFMLRHGVFVVSRGVERHTEYAESNGKPLSRHYVFMNHVFYAADGSSIETSTFGEGSGFNDEGLAKAHTRSLGAALREIFLICEEEGTTPARQAEQRTSQDFFAAAKSKGLAQADAVKILNQYKGKDQIAQAFAHLEKLELTPAPPAASPAPAPAPTATAPSSVAEAKPEPPAPVQPAPGAAPNTFPTKEDLPDSKKLAPREECIAQIKHLGWNHKFCTNPETWANFSKALLGCSADDAALETLQVGQRAVEKAITNKTITAWAREAWKVSSATQATAIGLIVAFHLTQPEAKLIEITGSMPQAKDKNAVKTMCMNLESFLTVEGGS